MRAPPSARISPRTSQGSSFGLLIPLDEALSAGSLEARAQLACLGGIGKGPNHGAIIGALGAQVDLMDRGLTTAKLVRELATGRYASQAENVLVFGPPGVGKTHLAIALGRAAVEAGHSTLFTSATALLSTLAKAETEGQLADKLGYFAKPKLLLIDELGYLPFEKRSAHLFFQLVARRYERGSMLITTNQMISQWGGVFGDDVLAAAILDRLLHHSHTLLIQGDSYRLKQKRKAGLLGGGPSAVRS